MFPPVIQNVEEIEHNDTSTETEATEDHMR